ncbi:MAG: class I SAM-dependent methyltransferase [Chitinophagaceae bacterium]|nr:MAG: class I SAM-dependent methyltransferase [Chitinophagaceae bacterium]
MITSSSLNNFKSRFSNRADNYVRYRPGYPAPAFDLMEKLASLNKVSSIVDIGSGTGLFSEPLLERGFSVTGVEPADEMRRAAEQRLARFSKFSSLPGTAEETGIEENTVDLVTIAQTFHWLDHNLTRQECQRILKAGGKVALAWNQQHEESEFEKEYTKLRETYRLYPPVATVIDEKLIHEFFSDGSIERFVFPNPQVLNFESLKGQLLSKSYSPLPGHESYETMINHLIRLFVRSNDNGFVTLNYETVVYCGELAS